MKNNLMKKEEAISFRLSTSEKTKVMLLAEKMNVTIASVFRILLDNPILDVCAELLNESKKESNDKN